MDNRLTLGSFEILNYIMILLAINTVGIRFLNIYQHII